MSRTVKIAIFAVIIIVAIIVFLCIRPSETEKALPISGPNINTSKDVSLVTGKNISLEDVFADGSYDDIAEPDTLPKATETITEIDYSVIPYDLFEDYDNNDIGDGLLGDLRRFDINAMTVKFDNIYFYPGLRVCDIIDNSYWYTLLEYDIIKPGESAFVCLENSFWTAKEVKLNDVKDNRNGDVILWIHNFDSVDHEVRDCVIYKYQISYISCWDEFSEHPPLEYRGLGFGSEDIDDAAESVTTVITDGGPVTRYQYGSIDACQVLLDVVEDKGLMSVTVSYNLYYLSEKLDSKGGDING